MQLLPVEIFAAMRITEDYKPKCSTEKNTVSYYNCF